MCARRVCALAGACFAFFLGAMPLRAQVVVGRVFGHGESEPIGGAVVLLTTESGARVRGVLTNAEGRFVLVAPEPGSYRLRAEMIGHRTAESSAFSVGRLPVVVDIALPVQPVPLEGVMVRAESRCAMGRERGAVTVAVWEEVKKALRSEEVGREADLYAFEIEETRNTRDPRTHRDSVIASRSRATARSPFRTLPAAELAASGYARVEGGRTVIYGPTPETLLSPEFEETHCFGLQGSGGRVGLFFEPVGGRDVTDVAGVIWVDAKTSELRRIEYRFTNVPDRLMAGRYAGSAEFQRMECGAWIISRWRLDVPANMAEARVTSIERLAAAPLSPPPSPPGTRSSPPPPE